MNSKVSTAAAGRVRNFARDRSGATAIEYSLIVSLIFVAVVGSVKAFTSTTQSNYNTISSTIGSAVSGDS